MKYEIKTQLGIRVKRNNHKSRHEGIGVEDHKSGYGMESLKGGMLVKEVGLKKGCTSSISLMFSVITEKCFSSIFKFPIPTNKYYE